MAGNFVNDSFLVQLWLDICLIIIYPGVLQMLSIYSTAIFHYSLPAKTDKIQVEDDTTRRSKCACSS